MEYDSECNEFQLECFNYIAINWHDLNKTEKALEFFELHVDIESLKSSQMHCNILNTYSNYLGNLGKYDRKRSVLESVLKIAEEQGYKSQIGDALFALGTLYIDLRDFTRANTYLTRAEQIGRQNDDWSLVSKSLTEISECLYHLNEFNKSIEKAGEAYKVYPKPENQLKSYITLGQCYMALIFNEIEPNKNKNFQTSKDYFERGLKLAEEQNNLKKVFVCRSQLGRIHVYNNLFDEALKYLDAAETCAVTTTDKTFLYQIYTECFLGICFSEKKQEPLSEKGRFALENAEKWLEKQDQFNNQIWDELKQDNDKISWSEQELIKDYFQQVKWLLGKKFEALIAAEKFRARSLKDSMKLRQPVTEQFLKSVAHKLNQPIVFFSSSYHSCYEFMCWIMISKNNDVNIISQMINLKDISENESKQISNDTKILSSKANDRNAIVNSSLERSESPFLQRKFLKESKKQQPKVFEDYQRKFNHMWNKYIEPHLSTYKSSQKNKLIVIPDRELWQVSYSLLTDENNKLLFHKCVISQALSISYLKTDDKPANFEAERNGSIALVIGNPDDSLPKAKIESQNVRKLLKGKLQIKHLTGRAATKTAVLSSLPKARLFHIAAHATDEKSSDKQLPGCLLLAKDSVTDKSEILSTEEIQSLDLRGLQLAFLNCCLTGSGKVSSEGLIGLARSFLYAGAKEIVVSMRPVSDTKITCDFVNKFYEKYLGEADVALNEAQKYMEQLPGVDSSQWGFYYVLR